MIIIVSGLLSKTFFVSDFHQGIIGESWFVRTACDHSPGREV